jgi:hypothetical protein
LALRHTPIDAIVVTIARHGLGRMGTMRTAALFALLACAMAGGANAREVCHDVEGLSGSSGGIHNMSRQCTTVIGPDRAQPHAQPSYGAIAFDPLHAAAGMSHSFGTRADAEKKAMSECASFEKDCEIAVWFEDRCGAVATDYATKAPSEYWALGLKETDAKVGALKKCTDDHGKKCKVVVSQCSFR